MTESRAYGKARANKALLQVVGNLCFLLLLVAFVVTAISLDPSTAQERPGNPPALSSHPAKIKAEIGWEPRYADIEAAAREARRSREASAHLPRPSLP